MLEGFAYCRILYDEKGAPDDWVYLDVNPAFYRLTGLADVVGKPVTQILPTIKQANPELLDIYGRVASTGEPAEFDIDFTPLDRWLHVSASRPREGEFVAFFYDVTERKLAERDLQASEDRFRSLFEHSPMGVFVGVPDGSITAANPAACRMFGHSEAEMIANGRHRLLDSEDPRLRPTLEERARTGLVHAVELTAIRSDGSRFPVEVDSFIVGSEPSRSFVLMRDITHRLEMESSLRRSEVEARETVERLTRAQRLGRMGDWEWDVASGEVRWSEEVYRIYGVGPDFEATFDAIVPMTHPEDAERNLRDAQAIVDDPERSSSALNFRIIRPDGGVRHIFQTIAVDRDAGGTATRLFGIMQDVTEVREAEAALSQSERRLSRLYEAGLVGVVFWTAEGAITDANDRFLEMLGYTREELRTGRVNWAAMTPPKWGARDQESLEELRTTGRNAAPFEKEYYRKDGTPLPILVTGATLDDEGRHGVALVLDISDQKLAEEGLRRLNLELEERVRRRTMDLEAANAELESFSYSVSHDLRAPLRHISGFAKLLEEHVGQGDEETKHFVDVITRSAFQMGVLIDDLLKFSRVGRAEMHVERVDMEQLVREVLEVGTSDLGDRGVEVTVGEVASAVGDRTLLRQVWANLIGNALKYTRPRDPALIEIGSRREHAEAVYWVKDNGVGFDMQYAARLFHVFERLHRSEEFEGSGIGLANVQRIVGRHGGRCWVQARVDVGATFFFAVPLG
jgi:PAS domain S-box-containing protein